MTLKTQAIVLAAIVLIAMALGSCGTETGTGQPENGDSVATPGTPENPAELPDQVRIVTDAPMPGSPAATQPAVTLMDVAQVREMYATILALPVLPADSMCTAERGPHYALTFLQGDKTVATVEFHRDGCWPVFIAGDSTTRKGSTAFVEQLDLALTIATPTP